MTAGFLPQLSSNDNAENGCCLHDINAMDILPSAGALPGKTAFCEVIGIPAMGLDGSPGPRIIPSPKEQK